MQTLWQFFLTTFRMDMKRIIAYPISFWLVVFTVPFWSVVQIIFLTSIFLHTNNYFGYTIYEAYIFIGTFRIVQSIAYFFFYSRLIQLNELIRGSSGETFDIVLTRPIDSQLYGTVGRYALGNIGPFLIGIGIVIFGFSHVSIHVSTLEFLSYIIVLFLGAFLIYLIFLFFQTFLFWSPELRVTESLWDSYQELGQYPSSLYTGAIGILVNLIIPITLMAAIPTNILFGKIPLPTLFVYIIVLIILFFLTRIFWKFSISKYSSFSS